VSNDAHLTQRPPHVHPGYVDQFDARVVVCDSHSIVIEPVLLIPDRPGNAGDRGTVAGLGIQYVEDDPAGSRIGLRDTSAFHVGAVVHVAVDFRRRLALLRIATALAVLQWLVGQRWPAYRIASVEKEPGVAWLTIEGRIDQRVEDLEAEVNAHIASSRPVHVTTRDDGVGLIEIPGLPILPSLDRHVAKTREIGGVTIKDVTGTSDGKQCLLIRLLPPEPLI
jgi:Ser-tRNA(Ala) deacylase AlaX